MQKLLIATHNRGKLAELSKFLSDLPLEILSLDDVGIDEEIEESGKTYEENSQKKALFYAKKSGLPSLSDDGGIEINALNGEPGVQSKYWAKNEEAIIRKLKKIAKNLPEKNRGAIFKVVISIALPSGKVWSVGDQIEGIITKSSHIKRQIGYPYRSFFYIPKLRKWYHKDQLTDDERRMYNHRYKAIQKLKTIIEKEIIND